LPSQAQVEIEVARIEAAIGRRGAKRARGRKAAAAIGIGLVLSGAVAYAAHRVISDRSSSAALAPVIEAQAKLAKPRNRPRASVASQHEQKLPADEASRTPASRPRNPERVPALERRAGWAEVNTALQAGDSEKARDGLRRLATAPDEPTRAKAHLGLAQLALARGDCTLARIEAQQVLAPSNVPDKLRARARRLLERCDGSTRR
jgi:hypothetical protein